MGILGNIKTKALTYYYPDTKKPALDNINTTINEGEFVLIVGASGCGKSTLLRAISRLIPDFFGGISSGEIYLDGKALKTYDRKDLVQKVGILFQDPESQIVMTSVEQEIVFGMENIGLANELMMRRTMEVSTALDMSGYLHSFIPELSGGQKQKTALASILAMHPDIILLDEPTSQLDPVAAEEIITILRRLNEENGITVVMIEQRLERCFHIADRVLVMDAGKIVYDQNNPQKLASWAVKNNSPFIPPMGKLFAHMGYSSVPLTVKEGRKILNAFPLPVNAANENLVNRKKRVDKPIEGEYVIDVEKLWFTYPNGTEALKNINLKVNPGSITAIMGDNGAGKSTLIKNIRGLLKPGRGKINVLNRNTKNLSLEELAPLVGYLGQNPNDYLFLPTVQEEIDFTLNNLKISDNGFCEKLVRQLNLTEHLDSNPRDLSTGERQRVALASVLAPRPAVLLLDEPTRGLDYKLKEELGRILLELSRTGITIIMVTHDVEFASEFGSDIVFMSAGTIIAGGSKYDMLTGATFYSPQINRLFNNIIDKVITFDDGKEQFQRLLAAKPGKAIG